MTDFFLSKPIPFPGTYRPQIDTAAPKPAIFLRVGDKVKRIAKQPDGAEYKDGEVIEVNGQYAKVRARKLRSPWHNCMREVWVKGSDCMIKYTTRMPKK